MTTTFTYNITNFNPINTNMIFTIIYELNDKSIKEKTVTINLEENKLINYLSVNPKHYLEINTGNIVIIHTINRLIVGDIDNIMKRATQFEYDKWMLREFPDSDNATIYNTLYKSIIN